MAKMMIQSIILQITDRFLGRQFYSDSFVILKYLHISNGAEYSLLPLLGHFLRITHKFPTLLLLYLHKQTLAVSRDIDNLSEWFLSLELGDGIEFIEGKVDVFGDVAGVGEGFVADEDEEALVGEEEALVFLFEQGIQILLAFDRLQVRLLLYLLLQLFAYQSPPLAFLLLHFT